MSSCLFFWHFCVHLPTPAFVLHLSLSLTLHERGAFSNKNPLLQTSFSTNISHATLSLSFFIERILENIWALYDSTVFVLTCSLIVISISDVSCHMLATFTHYVHPCYETCGLCCCGSSTSTLQLIMDLGKLWKYHTQIQWGASRYGHLELLLPAFWWFPAAESPPSNRRVSPRDFL